MARKEEYTKEQLLQKGLSFVEENGIEVLTVRKLAEYIGCSTQPFFKNYKNMQEYKLDLKMYLRKDYENFISKYIDENNYLYTISYAYALYGKKKPNIFHSLFLTDLAGSRTVKQVLKTQRNIPTINAMTKQYNISLKEAENIYRDVRFYTHGIGSQLSNKSIKLTDKEIGDLIQNIINIIIK